VGNDTKVIFDKAFKAHQRGDLTDAVTGYNRILEIDPNNFQAKSLKGAVMLQANLIQDGVKLLAECVKENDRDPTVLSNLGFGLLQLGKPELGLKYARMAHDLNPSGAEILATMAKCLLELGEFQEAITQAHKALEMQPANPSARHSLIFAQAMTIGVTETLDQVRRAEGGLASIADDTKLSLIPELAKDEKHEEILELLETFESDGHLVWNLHKLKALLALQRTDEAVTIGGIVLTQKDQLALERATDFQSDHPRRILNNKNLIPANRRIIAFSLWGDDSKYTHNAVLNAKLMHQIYPDWMARFYVDDTVPEPIIQALRDYGAQVQFVATDDREYLKLFWRFLAHDDKTIDLFMCRDCDAVISEREAVAVRDWLNSDCSFHIMRDHPEHAELIMAGMWGGITNYLSPLMDLAVDYYERHSNKWRWVDQDFLRDIVWPAIKDDCLTHDTYFQFGVNASKFPDDAPFDPNNHVGGYNPTEWRVTEQ